LEDIKENPREKEGKEELTVPELLPLDPLDLP